MSRIVSALSLILAAALAAGCADGVKTEASYPTRQKGSDKILYSDQKRETIWGEDETLTTRLFGKDEDKGAAGGGALGVNSYLWRASLDTVAFMPVTTADPFGGVVLTDWYENPDHPGERFKINIYILDRQLRADGIKAAVFKQEKKGGGWRDVKVAPSLPTEVENSILTRARELRVAGMGTGKN